LAVSLLGSGVSLGDSCNPGSMGKLIQYTLVALMVGLAVKSLPVSRSTSVHLSPKSSP